MHKILNPFEIPKYFINIFKLKNLYKLYFLDDENGLSINEKKSKKLKRIGKILDDFFLKITSIEVFGREFLF